MSEIAKLHDEISTCKGEKSIILGNGFGRSYDVASGEDNFRWTNLLDLCDIVDKNAPVYKLLEQCHFDFELVHQKLNNAIDVISEYDSENELISRLQEQVQYLRNQLIIAIGNSHPSSFSRQSGGKGYEAEKIEKMVTTCRNFLDGFDYVFSLNYDLLLYWVRCFGSPLGKDSFKKVEDKLVFFPDKNASYLFPHGALFLYRDGMSAVKSMTSINYPILRRVQDNIASGIFPMCISEGTGEQKLEAIKSNSYLHFAYERIKECEGTIFTFGCSFQDKKDDHIIKAMLLSQATKIVIGFRYNEATFYRLKGIFAQPELQTTKEIVLAEVEGTVLW